MIHLHLVDNLLEPGKRRSEELAWLPGLTFADVVPEPFRSDPNLVVARHGERVHDLSLLLSRGDHVLVSRTPGATFLPQLVLLLIVTALEVALAPKIPPVERGDERSPTYGFSGITPTRAEGTPIPVYFGKLRVGGQIISEFVQSRGPLGSWYNALIALGHGPIHSVCGVTSDTAPDAPLRSDGPEEQRVPGTLFINDTAATDYDGVELHVRLGTAEQLAIPGFNLDEQTTTIDVPLTGASSDGATYDWMLPFWPMNPGGSTSPELAIEDATWSTYGVAQSILDRDVDHFTVVVSYPQGLYSVASTGSPYEFATSLAVRYRELDGGGAPITTGGPHGDGYVRLRPTPLFRAEVQGPFTLDFSFPFYDPQTFVLPTRSALASFNFGTASDSSAQAWMDRSGGLTYPAAWASGSTTSQISAEWWACLRPNGLVAGLPDLQREAHVMDLLDTTAHRGFRVSYRLQQFQIAAGQFRSRIVPVVSVGNGTTIKQYYDRNPSGQTAVATAEELGDAHWVGVLHMQADAPQQDWSYGAFTYEPNSVGTQDRLRIYCDGELIIEVVADIGLTMPASSTPFNLGRRQGSDSTNREFFRGHIDEVLLYSIVLSSETIRASFNSGFGTYHSLPAGLVAGWHFEDGTPPTGVQGTGATAANFSALSNDLTLHSSSSSDLIRSGSLLGIMDRQQPANTIKLSRYRVEVMRGLKDVTTTSRVDDMRWQELRTHVDTQFSYPGIALMAVRVKAQDKVSGSKPVITGVVEGRLCPEWDGASTSQPSFTDVYTRNPAWVLAFLHLNRRAGLGQFFANRQLDVQSFQEAADYFDQLVYDLRGDRRALDDAAGPITNLIYDGSAYGGLGQVEVQFKPGIDPPEHLIAGSYVGFHDLNTPATNAGRVFQDCNVPTVRGFLVVEVLTSVENGGAGGLIRAQYQPDASAPLADPPWGGAGDLVLALNGTSPDLIGTLEGREPRCCYDGAVDQARPANDVLQSVAATCLMIILREGRRVRLRVLKPEPVVDLLGQTQEIQDTFEITYASASTRNNAYDVSILDDSQLWDRSPVSLEDQAVADTTNLGAVRRGTLNYDGVTRRSQATRLMQFVLNSNRLVLRSGKFTASIDALAMEVADVFQLAHDVVPRGISGRVVSSASLGSIVLDRTLVLEMGKTYDLSVRNLGGSYVTRTVTSAAGTYVAAVDALTVTPDFDAAPEVGQAVILCEQGQELLARISRLTLTKDLQRAVEWLEYDGAVFDVDEFGEVPDLPSALNQHVAQLESSLQPPSNPSAFTVRERLVRTPGAAAIPHAALTWKHDPATVQLVDHTDLFLALELGPFRHVGTAQGATENALVRLPDLRPGTKLRFALQPVGRGGARRDLARAAVTRLAVFGRASRPAAPLDLTASLSGETAVFEVTPGDARAQVPHQVKVGGWLLGQPLSAIGTGQRSAISSSFLLGAVNLAGEKDPPLHVRARAADGAVSEQLMLSWNARPLGFDDLTGQPDTTMEEQSWEDFVDGWVDDSIVHTVGDPFFGDDHLHRNADGEAEFADDSLSGSYYTRDVAIYPIGGALGTAQLVYVHAFAVAEQVHPLTWDEATFTWDEAEQLSWEGPASDIGDPDDLGQCTLRILVRFMHPDFTWSDWQDYRPAKASCVTAQFRFDVTRPSADFQVRIRRFSTKMTLVPEQTGGGGGGGSGSGSGYVPQLGYSEA